MANAKPPARARRAIAKVAAWAGLAATFVAAGVVGLVVHAELPASRRLVARTLTRALSASVQGSVTVENIDALGLRGLDGVAAQVRDADGRDVLVARGIRIRVSLPEIVQAVLFAKGESTLTVDRLRIERIELTLIPDEAGEPTLVRALSPKPSEPGTGPAVAEPGLGLWLPAIRIREAVVRGELEAMGRATVPVDLAVARLRASVFASNERLSVNAERFGFVASELPLGLVAGEAAASSADWRGTAQARFEMPSASGAPYSVFGSVDGFLDEVQTSLRGQADGDRVDLALELPRARAESLRALFPTLPIHDTASLSAHVRGQLPELSAWARIRLGDGEVEAQGPLTLGETPEARLHVDLRDLDVRALEPTAPKTSIGGRGEISLRLPEEGFEGGFELRTEPAPVEDWTLPSISMRGAFAPQRFETTATVHVPGMPTHIRKLVIRPATRGEGVTVELEADGEVPSMARMPMLEGLGQGKAQWYARGTLSAGRIDSHFGVLLRDYARDDVKLQQAAIVGRMTGSLDRPTVDASLVGRDLHLAGLDFRNLRATALGPLSRPRLVASLEHDRLPLLTAKGRVRWGKGTVVDGLELSASRRDISVVARAEKASFASEAIDVPSFTIEGAGRVEGSVRVEPGRLSLRAKTQEELDVGLLTALFESRSQAAMAVARLRNGALSEAFPILWSNYVDGMAASFDLELEKSRQVERGHLELQIGHRNRTALPELRVRADVRVNGSQVSGEGVTVALGNLVSLTALPEQATLGGSLLEPASWEKVTGKLSLRSSVDFDEVNHLAQLLPADVLPFRKLAGKLSTRVALQRERGDEFPDLELATTTKGLELEAEIPTGEEQETWSSRGLDLSLAGSIDVQEERARLRGVVAYEGRELVELVAEAEPPFTQMLETPRRARELFEKAPLAVHLRVPRTSLASLPVFLRPSWFEGDVQLSGDLHGSLETPIVTVEASGYGIVSRERGDVPLLVGAYATYGFSETEVQLRVTEPSGGDVMVGATVQASLANLVSPPAIEGEPQAGYADRVRHFLLEGAVADARLRANAFRVAPFQPLVSHVFSQLDGRIDGSFRMHQEPTEKGVSRTLEGLADIRSGIVQLPEIGQELHDATAHIVAEGSAIQVKDISASGVTGRLSGEMTIAHDNLAFESLRGTIHIAERERLPLTLEGVSYGEGWGRVNLFLRKGTDDGGLPATLLDVDIPEFQVNLPASSTRNLQPLGDNPRIHVGLRDEHGEIVPVPLGPPKEARGDSRWLVHFRLGNRVMVRRGNLLQIGLTGAPRMAITDRAYASGDVWMTGGFVEVFGKRFNLVHGNVQFHPATDVGNPWVTVSASWDAPDATRVYADYVGPLKTGTLTLRSEPARTPSEILALVLMGSTMSDLELSAQQGEAGAAAAGVGTSLAAAGLNTVLSGVTGTTITTRVDTSVAQNPRPEVAIRLSDSVTAEVAYSTGLPAPGQNPDRVLVTLGWHFRESWSLSTTVGDKGSSVVDVIWQYRY